MAVTVLSRHGGIMLYSSEAGYRTLMYNFCSSGGAATIVTLSVAMATLDNECCYRRQSLLWRPHVDLDRVSQIIQLLLWIHGEIVTVDMV